MVGCFPTRMIVFQSNYYYYFKCICSLQVLGKQSRHNQDKSPSFETFTCADIPQTLKPDSAYHKLWLRMALTIMRPIQITHSSLKLWPTHIKSNGVQVKSEKDVQNSKFPQHKFLHGGITCVNQYLFSILFSAYL